VSPPLRWPLHPQPRPLESLSSWLERIARTYHLTVSDLLTRNLGQGGAVAPELIDSDPPAWMLAALAERTGTSLAQLHAMTLAGWVPWLMDTLHMQPWDAQETFDTYIRQNSVLLAAGEAGHHRVTGPKRWAGPWWPARPVRRVCLACAEDADPRRALAWELPLTASCHEHGCRLEDSREVAVAAAHGEKPRPVPVSAALATLDRCTYEALITGRVTLPGRAVHAGVWFRMLRSLLDEVSLAGSTVSVHGRAALERAWQATGRPARGGLSIWRPYEQMDWPMQEAMLHAAAAVLQLAADGQITARGVLGPAVQPAPHRHVYDGDRPSSPCPSAWDELMAAVSEAVALARTDRDAARQLLVLLAIGCRTLSRFEEERSYLSGIGIPAGFLPSARELGRDDLA
jgi:TniQ